MSLKTRLIKLRNETDKEIERMLEETTLDTSEIKINETKDKPKNSAKKSLR